MDAKARLDLLRDLASLPRETEWVEFKTNNDSPERIGELISALSNSAALHHKERGYLVWGVRDADHELVGTTVHFAALKKGAEDVEHWLTIQLSPQIHFWVRSLDVDSKHFEILEIEPANNTAVKFRNVAYIRVGEYTKPLHKYPGKERELWKVLTHQSFESGIAASSLDLEDALARLSYTDYFSLAGASKPGSPDTIAETLCSEGILKTSGSRFDISNLGAVLFARNLRDFGPLERKAIRVVFYNGTNRLSASREMGGRRGYASGFKGIVDFLMRTLPTSEEIQEALRVSVPRFPEIALRELTANLMIHQSFDISGAGPMIEVFSDRLEFTSPGPPLIQPQRFLDHRPQSRNENLAQLMRRLNICEERGSGIDKVIHAAEVFQLPAPDFQAPGESTVAVMFAPRPFAEMTRDERIRACYQHAGLQVVSGRVMTNASLRKRFRFGNTDSDVAKASRIISDAVEVGAIKSYNPASKTRRHATYVPYWGAEADSGTAEPGMPSEGKAEL